MVAGGPAAAEWKLRDYPQSGRPPRRTAAVATRPTEVFLSLEDPLNPRVLAVATPKGATGRVIRYPHPSPDAHHSARTMHDATPSVNKATRTTWFEAANHDAPTYEWGPMPSHLFQPPDHTSRDATDAMLFGHPLHTNTSSLNQATPMRDGHKKLEQWRRLRGQRNIHERGAASRRWADDASEAPQFMQHSRSTSVWSVESADGRDPEQRPAWVNPVDCSATQTDGDACLEEAEPAARPAPAAGTSSDAIRMPEIAHCTDDFPRSDGWDRWSNAVSSLPAASTATASPPPSSLHAMREQESQGDDTKQRVHLTNIIRARERCSSASSSSSASDAPVPHRAEAAPTNTEPDKSATTDPSKEALFAVFQAQQEDMFRIIAAQHERIEALSSQQHGQPRDVAVERPTQGSDHGEDAKCVASGTSSGHRKTLNAVVRQSTPVVVDADVVASTMVATPAHGGSSRVVGRPAHDDATQTAERLNTMHTSAVQADAPPSTTQTTQTPIVELRGMYVDPEFLDDRDTQRELAVLKGILEIDQNAQAAYRVRTEESMAQTNQRRELSRKLTRHLALQQRSPVNAAWSRSQSAKSNDSGQRTLPRPPEPPLAAAVSPAIHSQYSVPSIANAALEQSVAPREPSSSVVDAVTMTESTRWHPDVGGERRDAGTARMTPVPTPTVCDASTDASVAYGDHPPHGWGTRSQGGVEEERAQEPKLRTEVVPAGIAPDPRFVPVRDVNRSHLSQSARTASPQPPPRTHDPMQAFLALRDRYLSVRGGHDQRTNPTPSSSTSNWRRV